MTNSIKNKTISAFKWVSAMQAYMFAGRFIINLILAKLLLPEDFGLVAIVTILIEILVAIADLGFNAALIQKEKLSDNHINTAFFLNAGLSIILLLIIVLIANPLAIFYNDLRLTSLIQLMAIILFVRAISSVQIALCDRDLKFRKTVIIFSISLTISSVLKIVLALKGFAASSIVIGEVVNHSLISIIFWITSQWIPRLKLINKNSFKDLFSFGSNIMLTNTISLLSQKIDVMIIGKLVSISLLGIYSFSFMIATIVTSFINTIVQRVIFPSFSRIKDNIQEVKNLYLQATKYIAIISVPVNVGLFFIAPEFIDLFFPKWHESIIIIRILSIFGVSNALGGILWGQVLKAKGKTRLVLVLTIIRLIALITFILIGSKYGIVGIAISVTVYGWIFRFVYQHIVNKIIEISMMDYLKSLVHAIVLNLTLISFLLMVRGLFNVLNLTDIMLFFTLVIVGILTYFIGIKYIYPSDFKYVKELIVKRNA